MKEILYGTNIINKVIKDIREAKTEDEAKKILLDNIVLLNSTEEVSSIINQSLIEGPNPVNFEDDPRFIESFEKFTSGEIGIGKEEYDGLTKEEREERLSKVIWIHDGKQDEVYTEKSGRRYTLDENGNKVYITIEQPEIGFSLVNENRTEAQDAANLFQQRLESGYFDAEFEKCRQLEKGIGEPMNLSEENISKELEKYDKELKILAELMPDELGNLSVEKPSKKQDKSILEGTMFHEVNALEDRPNVRTRKDNNK